LAVHQHRARPDVDPVRDTIAVAALDTGISPIVRVPFMQHTMATRVVPLIRSPSKGKTMKYLVPPIVIPILLFIDIAAYGMLGPPIIAIILPLPRRTRRPGKARGGARLTVFRRRSEQRSPR
jgi:hypothetical protein